MDIIHVAIITCYLRLELIRAACKLIFKSNKFDGSEVDWVPCVGCEVGNRSSFNHPDTLSFQAKHPCREHSGGSERIGKREIVALILQLPRWQRA
tara:strand:- start:86 stop:370 length:285 start_codon:yes stop_codon:yes gene_type:complete